MVNGQMVKGAMLKLLAAGYKLAFNSSKKLFIFSNDCIMPNFSSAFLLFFKNFLLCQYDVKFDLYIIALNLINTN